MGKSRPAIYAMAIGIFASSIASSSLGQDRGQSLFNQRCAACHAQGLERAPHLDELERLSPDTIFIALTRGTMTIQAQGLSTEDIAAIASHLTGQQPSITGDTKIAITNVCSGGTSPSMTNSDWNGWGNELANGRYQSKPGLSAVDVPKLKPKWVFGLPGDSAYGQPTVVDGRVYLTSFAGHVFSLDAETGCTLWGYDAGASSRTAVSIAKIGDRLIALLGDDKAFVHGLDALTGAPLWKVNLENHPAARITGSPSYYNGNVYVSVSSLEEGVGTQLTYPCCTFRGSVAAINAANGKLLWQSYTIPEEPKPIRVNGSGTQLYGPAGAAIWMSPTIDSKRNRLYVGTGNSYTEVSTDYSDSIIAFDLDNGERLWKQQVTPGDNYIVGCRGKRGKDNNCPDEAGPDFDFGASPILRAVDGRDMIFMGQKSGMVYAFDAEKGGKLLWKEHVHPGSALGGVQWGMSADNEYIYVSNAFRFPSTTTPPGGLTALSLSKGKTVWNTPAPENDCSWGRQGCSPAQSQAVSSMPGVVFSGSIDGHIRAYASADGKILWDFDTGIGFDAVNDVETKGGSLDGGGPTIANGTVFLMSGYDRLGGHGGNALIAFSVDGK